MTPDASTPDSGPGGSGPFRDPRWISGVAYTTSLSPSGEFRFDAPAFELGSLLEVEPAEMTRMLNERSVPFVNEDEPAIWESILQSAKNLTPWQREVHLRGARTGRDIWLRVHSVPTRQPDGTVIWNGMLFEITDLKLAQERLWKAYQQISSHMDNTPLAVVEWEAKGRVVRWSLQAERMFGWSAGEVVGRSLFDFNLVHPEDAERIGLKMQDLVEKRTLRNRAVNRNVTKDGRVLTCEWYNSVVFDEGGKLLTVLSLGMDVTERVAAERALARSEGLFRTAVDAAGMFVWEWDLPAGRIAYSADFATYYGLPPDRDYEDAEIAAAAIHPLDAPEITSSFQRILESDSSFRLEFRGATPAADGGERWFVSRGQVVRDPTGRPLRIVATTFDVTERKRAELEKTQFDRQLQEAQKLEMLGVLAGGIAHDFNNLLTVVLGNASLARKTVAEDASTQEYLDQIEAACQRAAGLCRQMLAYAGRGHVNLERADLNQIIRDSAGLIGMSAENRVRIEYTLHDPLPAVTADLSQLRQVLLNLVMNAAEAVASDAGRVFVRTGTTTVKDRETMAGFQAPLAPGRYVFLDVVDNGQGMPEPVRTRIFDPFFTTKFAGRGLGLPATLGIVRAHKGSIRVESTPGRGTLVRVLWPMASGEMIPRPPVVPAPPPRVSYLAVPREHGTALVVDDEMYVREVAASSLEEMGFQTLVADGGSAAMELFVGQQASLRVAVIDLIMPGMNGTELVANLRAIDPAFPIVLISGFTDRGLVNPVPGTGRTLFLQKPFLPEELMTAVREVLMTE